MLVSCDQLGREVLINFPPQRIVSLVPSITELLYDLGLGKEIVGKTKFCCYPAVGLECSSIVGGTKNYSISKIKQLAPDLIIANKEENVESTINELKELFPTWVSDVATTSEAIELIKSIGKITNRSHTAYSLSEAVIKGLDEIGGTFSGKIAYLIWNDPIMVAGQNTFINSVLNHLGFENVIDQNRYPEISFQELLALDPEHIFLSSEPFPFKQKHLDYFRSCFPNANTVLVNGEMFSWYGSRMLKLESYFKGLEIS